MQNDKVSVIIPVYNVEQHLEKCLDSVLGQTHRNLEVLLVDDGSRDRSGEICDAYASRDDRIVCVHQENGGVSKARNRGLAMATGDYYHFMDSDDFLEPDAYEYLLKELKAAGAEAAGFEYYTTFPDREIQHRRAASHCGVRDNQGTIYEHLFSGNDFLATKLLPAHAVQGLRFHEDIYRDEDTLFGTEALHRVERSVFLERPLYHYVQSEESACRGEFRPNQLSAVKVIPIMEPFLKQHYPAFLSPWRIGYMQLMILLYGDMYLDKKSYEQEQDKIHSVFCELYREEGIKNVRSAKTKAKLMLFRCAPKLFCRIHKAIHKL